MRAYRLGSWLLAANSVIGAGLESLGITPLVWVLMELVEAFAHGKNGTL